MLSILDQLRPIMHAKTRKEKECRGLGKSERIRQTLLVLSGATGPLSTYEIASTIRAANPGVLGIRTDIIKGALRALKKSGLVDEVGTDEVSKTSLWRKTTS